MLKRMQRARQHACSGLSYLIAIAPCMDALEAFGKADARALAGAAVRG
jgi:hypothetical protein